MSTNPNLDDFVVRASDGLNSWRLFRIQQKEPLIIGGVVYTSPADGASVDAFQRARVSNPVSLFESSMEVDDQPLVWDSEVTGSGASTYNTNQSSVTLSIGGATSSSYRQSRQYTRYQPGKSLLVLFTFVLGARATDVTRRVGYFDASNGVFLEQSGVDIAWVVRSNASGTPIDTRVTQPSWDIDTLDGSGVSELTLSETSANIGIIDLEWLGVGRVRAGFVLNGQVYYAHGFENLGINQVYMSRASLPMRYEISSGEGASAGTYNLVQICSTVISEGGYLPRGMIRSASNGAVERTVTAADYLPLVAIRLKAAYNRATLFPIGVEVGNSSGSLCHMELAMRATVTGGAWVSVSEAVEANVTGTTTSGGYVIAETYVDKNKTLGSLEIDSTTLVNGANLAGTADIIVLRAKSLSGNVQVAAAIQWREIF